MTKAELDQIERQLGIRLPRKYRRFARHLPAPSDEDNSFQACFGDAAKVVQENRALRENGLNGLPWPPNLFCIGELDDNRHFIDLNKPGQWVYYASHEEGFDPTDLERFREGSLDDLVRAARDAAKENVPRSHWTALAEVVRSWLPLPRDEIRSAWTISHEGDEGIRLKSWTTEGDEAAEQMIRNMHRGDYFVLQLSFEPNAPFIGGKPAVVVVGERGRYYLVLHSRNDSWKMFDPSASPEPVQMVEGDPAYTCSGQNICRDVELLIKAVRAFVRRRRLLPSVKWVRLD